MNTIQIILHRYLKMDWPLYFSKAKFNDNQILIASWIINRIESAISKNRFTATFDLDPLWIYVNIDKLIPIISAYYFNERNIEVTCTIHWQYRDKKSVYLLTVLDLTKGFPFGIPAMYTRFLTDLDFMLYRISFRQTMMEWYKLTKCLTIKDPIVVKLNVLLKSFDTFSLRSFLEYDLKMEFAFLGYDLIRNCSNCSNCSNLILLPTES